MTDRICDLIALAFMLAAFVYADWSTRRSHNVTVDSLERTIRLLEGIAEDQNHAR